MVFPWRIAALLLALLPALAQPAAAGEFSVEEQKLVADIRQKMDQTTQLLIYAYENEEKMDLAEMQRVLVVFRELAKWFENKIPDRTFERRTGSFCVGSASFASSYWRNTEYYYRYKGSEDGKYVGAPRTLKELKDRQKDDLEGHFFSFHRCYIHLDQIPTEIEDIKIAPKININYIGAIRKNSLELVQEINNTIAVDNYNNIKKLLEKSENLYKYYHSIYNFKFDGLMCQNLVYFPKYFMKDYILRHGETSRKEQLSPSLFKIGYNGLLYFYYRNVKLCDNHLKEYKEKRP